MENTVSELRLPLSKEAAWPHPLLAAELLDLKEIWLKKLNQQKNFGYKALHKVKTCCWVFPVYQVHQIGHLKHQPLLLYCLHRSYPPVKWGQSLQNTVKIKLVLNYQPPLWCTSPGVDHPTSKPKFDQGRLRPSTTSTTADKPRYCTASPWATAFWWGLGLTRGGNMS